MLSYYCGIFLATTIFGDVFRSCAILFLFPCLDVLVKEWETGSVAMEKDLRKEKAEPTSKI
jgi:hypothetical protein